MLLNELKAYNENCHKQGKVPRVTEFCIANNITISQFEEMKEDPDFSFQASMLNQTQLDLLISGGLEGTLNNQFVMFMLRSLHGFRDKGDASQVSESRVLFLPKELEALYIEKEDENE